MEAFNHFGSIALALAAELEVFAEDEANLAVENIQQHIIANGQVDTGEMLDSVHTEKQEDGTVDVVVGADYGAYQNYGTRFLPARPFFEPGLMDTQADMDEDLLFVARKVGIA